MNMAKFVKLILLLLFSVAFYSIVNDFSAAKVEQDSYAVTAMSGEQGNFVASAHSPFLPEAELVGGGSLTHQVTMSRIQRVNVIEYSLSMKGVLRNLANCEASLSRHQGRIYDTTTSYYCHPSSEYYVFALRRILI